MKIFELQGNQPIITVEGCLTFSELLERDTSKDKSRFFQELEFVYFYTDYKSYYLTYSEKERQQKIIEDYIKIPNWKPDIVVQKAIEKYKELQKTPTLGMLEDARFASNKLREYWKGIDYSKRDLKGNQLYKPTETSKTLIDVAKIIESIDKLEDRVRKEQAINSKARGDGEGGLLEFD